ncbi:MAG: HAMP domain-containing histidine kinase [Coriobacteriia bacterium]|nr:HAMP domain-containing histidine kinase [Coriobacteriia bacterium]
MSFHIKGKKTSTCDLPASEEELPVAKPVKGDNNSRRFSSRLAFAFALVAAFTAVLGGILNFIVWNAQFDKYVRDNLSIIAQGIAAAGSNAYGLYGGWNFSSLTNIPQVGVSADVAVQILNKKGNIIYDEATVRSHAKAMTTVTSQNTSSTAIVDMDAQPTGEVLSSPVMYSGVQVGTVRVWAYGSSSLLTARDLEWRNSSMIALAIAAIISIIIASIAGLRYSRSVSRPISVIAETAQSIRAGDMNARTNLVGEDEISQLGITFDKMADSVEADRELERRLTSDVAHELRTPLMAIQATVEAMEDGVLPADSHHLGTVRNETRRLSRLTNAILELSRIENGSLPFHFDRIDLVNPVRSAIDAHSALLDMGSLTLDSELAENLYIRGDRDRLQQAIGNLLSNAARYTLEGGTVFVRTYEEDGLAVAEVKDTGMGIPEKDMGKMFNRFWRADAARARQTGGVGVGLSIAKEIVERHHGCIEVESKEGVGTAFRIKIPLV